jgi:hypothetical protein
MKQLIHSAFLGLFCFLFGYEFAAQTDFLPAIFSVSLSVFVFVTGKVLLDFVLSRWRSRYLKEVSSEWIYGWKRAEVKLESEGELLFQPLAHDARIPYRRDDRSVCALGENHKAPDRSCGCGFYAYRDLIGKLQTTKTTVLRVAFAGRVLPHEFGYRAERQVVTDIFLSRWCDACERPSEFIGPKNAGAEEYLTALCGKHAEERSWMLTCVEFFERHGVRVHLGKPPKSLVPETVDEIDWGQRPQPSLEP